jgi:DNA-binding response OmpR family regulator
MTEDPPLVLVVEDDAELASLYEAWLDGTYHVETAIGGREALDALSSELDVVLLDRRMPDVTGDEVLDEIRDRGIDCQVAMVTAVEPDVDIVDMRFDDYLVKPVSRDELLGVVEKLLTRSDYDERVRRMFSLASKKAVLETEVGRSALADREEYVELSEELERLRRELDRTVETLGEGGDEEFDLLFRRIDGGSQERN